MPKFSVELYGVKDQNASVCIVAKDNDDADHKAELLARYEEKHGGVIEWETQLPDVHGVVVQEVEEADEGDEAKVIDWAAVEAAVGSEEPTPTSPAPFPWERSDANTYMEIARRALTDAELFDRMVEELDISDEDMQRLRDQLQTFLDSDN